MPSLIDIRRRIRSVKNTQQITKAMKMVSAAKLRRAQDRVIAARPYATLLRQMLANVVAAVQADEEAVSNPLLVVRPEKRIELLLITGEKGLAGAFNANIIKASVKFAREEHPDAVLLRRGAFGHAMRPGRLGERSRCPMPRLRSHDIHRDRSGHPGCRPLAGTAGAAAWRRVRGRDRLRPCQRGAQRGASPCRPCATAVRLSRFAQQTWAKSVARCPTLPLCGSLPLPARGERKKMEPATLTTPS